MTQLAPTVPLVGLATGTAPSQQPLAPNPNDLSALVAPTAVGNFLLDALRNDNPDPAGSLVKGLVAGVVQSIQKSSEEAAKQAEIQRQQDQKKAEEEAAKAAMAQAEADKAARIIASADTPSEIKEAESMAAITNAPHSFRAIGIGTAAQNAFTAASVQIDEQTVRLQRMVLEVETTVHLGEQKLPFSRFGTAMPDVSVTAADGNITLPRGTEVTINPDGSIIPKVGTNAVIQKAVMDHGDGTPAVRFEGLPVKVDRPITLGPAQDRAEQRDQATGRVLQQAA